MVRLRTAHCLSIDIEGFVESMAESFSVPPEYFDPLKERYEIEANVDATLELIDSLKVKATFFILGRIANDQPDLVKKVASFGHEIACHSFNHLRVSGQTRSEFKNDVRGAKLLLEDVSGREVVGYRAPDFSIVSDSLWELDVLRETGYEYDSSLNPTDIHDVYGNPGIDRQICQLPSGLWEFPASTFRLLGRTIPFGGGGYMRLYPVWLTRMLVRGYESGKQPCMLYMHPWELGPSTPRISGLSFSRRFRHYFNIDNSSRILERVARDFMFDTAASIVRNCAGIRQAPEA